MTDTTIDRTLEQDLDAMEGLSMQLGWMARRRLERALEAHNLTAPQYVALRCIQKQSRGCSMTELAEHAGQVGATMTGIIDRLVESGLVLRERDTADRRALRVVLTPSGEKLLEQVGTEERAWLRQFMLALTLEERRNLIYLAERYLEVLRQNLNEEGRASKRG